MESYDHKKIEKKWQETWEEEKLNETSDVSDKPKKYVLDMFPYPSGDGLHVGHAKGYTATDVYSRMQKMSGFNVLHPMGWDAFGLPAEQYAVKNKVHPKVAMDENVKRYKSQLKNLGFNYDWDREINTTDPDFYKWTQWIFLQMFKNGLAYQSHEPINWCPDCQTGLANEDLEDGKCERCGTPVEKRPMRQWVLKITNYAERLLEGLTDLPWPESIKESQRNWIGRSEGAEIAFPVEKKFHYVLVHGYKSSPDGAFFTWLRKELEARGHTVEVPHLPNADDPDVNEQVETVLKETTFDENTIVLGHSLGSVVAACAIEKRGVSVHKLVTVAGFVINHGTERFQKYIKSQDFSCDYEKVRECVGSAVVLQDTSDELVTSALAGQLRDALGAKLVETKAKKSHFREAEEPEVLAHALDQMHVFTTRPDTLYGATYMVLAPEHPLIESYERDISNWEDVSEYIETAKKKTEIERTAEGKEKTGVKLEGVNVKNPANGESLPVYVADYVLSGYGSGAIMAVPAHDVRDYEFALKYEIPVRMVVAPSVQPASDAKDGYYEAIDTPGEEDELDDMVFTGAGMLVNSDTFNGMQSEEAKEEITKFVGGEMKTSYKLRDWVFSRQRYWGEPIPLIHCEDCGVVPVPEKDLPVTLPDVESYEPTGTGESPLSDIPEWVNTECPECGGAGKRETNTMPQWAGSSWYYLRYIDPKNEEMPVGKDKEKYWSPVDLYVGGAEHATRHLIYARFWHKFLQDIGVVNYPEPFTRLQNVGLIQAEDGRKMSKRYGNVINPDDVVEQVGADTVRVYEMFMGPFDQSVAWSTDHMTGSRRFIERVWKLSKKTDKDKDKEGSAELTSILHQTIKKVTEDIEALKFNTAISELMKLVREMENTESIAQSEYETLLQLLAPFAPHMTEELWREECAHEESIHVSAWPKHDEEKIKEQMQKIGVQINGKVRDSAEFPKDATEEEVMEIAKALPNISNYLEGANVKKVIYVPGKILNIVLE